MMRKLLAVAVCVSAFTVSALAASPAPAVTEQLSRVAAEVQAGEDLSAVKRLQRIYGYYVDKGRWADVAELFTDDARANYPAGVFVGKASIREHLFRNVGGVPVGQVGLGDNRLYNHMTIQPVVHLGADGTTAKGRWRAYAYFGNFGSSATWAEGVYEMDYAKQGGVWKISRLNYFSGFSAPYATGWVPPATASTNSVRRVLAHPADEPRDTSCEGFPAACIATFHYSNPGTTLTGGRAWDGNSLPRPQLAGDARRIAADLLRRAQRLRDEQDIENLQRIYGYYLDRAQWDQVADLFASNATIEFAQQGVYVGKARVRAFLGTLGPHGLVPGWLNDHMQLQTVVTLSADGKSARARSRELSMTGTFGKAGQWSEGLYENSYVKENGVWKFKSVHYYPTFITDYDLGWGKDAQPAPGPVAALPPDRPPSQVYAIYPKAHVPPYHYANPATVALQAAPAVSPVRDVQAALAQAGRLVERARDVHELENLESAYGYYLDKNLWNDLADLFTRDGSIELAQRGVYKGRRLRPFLFTVFGRGAEGPVQGRLGNHIQMQPVVHVAEDGRSARIRLRMQQQMSLGGRATMGGSVYENQAVKEDGLWRFSVVHTFNTWNANYEGGWAKGSSRGMPGMSTDFPPDTPPTQFIAMYPIVYEIPYHYANPVTGRTELPPLQPVAEQLLRYPLPTAPAAR